MFQLNHFTTILKLALQGILISGLLIACGGSSPPWMPLRATAEAEPEMTLLWVGRGECERFEDGVWVRRPEFDYEFNVEQRRFADHWESSKSLKRLHPNYDGSAGERTQTLFFAVDYQMPNTENSVTGKLRCSLGDGEVKTDPEFRKATVQIAANISSMAPFDRYIITQDYQYEAGTLEELVALNKGDKPWVRNKEHATLYSKNRFDHAPTTH